MLGKKWSVASPTAAEAVSMIMATSALATGTGSWQVMQPQLPSAAGPAGLADVTAAGPGSVWAFEFPSARGTTVAWKLSGRTWSHVQLPGTSNEGGAMVARASSATDVWVFTQTQTIADGRSTIMSSQALHWNGSTWATAGAFPEVISDAIVLSPDDVWAFGGTTWHYDGSSWSQVAGASGLDGASALSPTSIWAAGGNVVAHWNGTSWTRTSVTSLLPRVSQCCAYPGLDTVYAVSAGDVYAIADGHAQDQGGPLYILHWNGQAWSRVAASTAGSTDATAVSGDGSGGIWLAVKRNDGGPSVILHYSHGQLTTAGLPGPARQSYVVSLSRIPGSPDIVAGANPVSGSAQLILEYAP